MSSATTDYTSVVTINDLPDELLRLISISADPTEYCNFRRAMKRVWEYTTGREDHCIKHFLVTEVNEDCDTVTTLCGKNHSMFDQPAVIWDDGTQEWYQHGKKHRDNDLPAVVDVCGSNGWYQHDELHRDNDLPAVIFPSGTKHWYQRGNRHRDNNLPAVIYFDGTQERWQHGKLLYFPFND